MKIELLLDPNVQQFIHDNKNNKPQDVAFKAHGKFSFPVGFLVDQLSGPLKIAKKLPTWAQAEGIIFPPDISLQQCSSEETAHYKTQLVAAKTVIDLTGGFGVDVHAFSKVAEKVIHVEQNEWLSEVVAYNFKQLACTNVVCVTTTAEDFLDTLQTKVDLIYIDPARRDTGGGKVFKFADCEPNVVALKEQLFEHTDTLLVKASPMIDLTQGIRELGNVSKIWVIGIKNECKEVLFLVEKNFEGTALKFAVELNEGEVVELQEHEPVALPEGDLQAYLYDPFTVLHKMGSYASFLGNGLSKIASNTHLFTSDEIFEDFPGRVFKVVHLLKYTKKDLQKVLPEMKANVFTRNFADNPDGLKKKLGLKDGGEKYVVGFKDRNGKPCLALCELASL